MSDTNNNENWLFSVRNFLRPSKTIPSTSWRADTTWGLLNGKQSLQRFLILIFGLTLFGIGEAFLVITSLGNSPWVVLSEGISLNSNLNIGQATFFVSLMVLFFWIPLKQKPGFGTLANIVVISASIELGLLIIPDGNNLALKVFYVLFGILLVGIGSALYITCGLGTGPRDGLMTGLHYRTGGAGRSSSPWNRDGCSDHRCLAWRLVGRGNCPLCPAYWSICCNLPGCLRAAYLKVTNRVKPLPSVCRTASDNMSKTPC